MTRGTVVSFANGLRTNLRRPNACDVDFAVVGQHLARVNRFCGGTPDVDYCVLEHSIRGADAVYQTTNSETAAAYFLLHDGHEYVLGDDTTPKKETIAAEMQENFGVAGELILQVYKQIEYRHDVAIHEAAGLEWPAPLGISKIVKQFDLVMFVTEWRDLMKGIEHPDWSRYEGIEPLPKVIKPLPRDELIRAWQFRCRCWLPVFRKAVPA